MKPGSLDRALVILKRSVTVPFTQHSCQLWSRQAFRAEFNISQRDKSCRDKSCRLVVGLCSRDESRPGGPDGGCNSLPASCKMGITMRVKTLEQDEGVPPQTWDQGMKGSQDVTLANGAEGCRDRVLEVMRANHPEI